MNLEWSTHMSKSRIRYCTILALAAGLAACAGRPDPNVTSAPAGTDQAAAGTQSANALMVTVNHTDMNRSELTVYIEPANGVRTRLGTINSGEQKSFTFELAGVRSVRLVGISPSAGELKSPSLTVPSGAGVFWEVGINSLRIRR